MTTRPRRTTTVERRLASGALLALALATWSCPAAGQGAVARSAAPEPSAAPERSYETPPPTGIEQPAREGDDPARAAADVLLFVPRNVIDLLFEGTTAAAGLVSDRQIVPRVSELLSAPGGQLYVFPTMFVETGAPVSFGARMIGQSRDVTTSFRLGYGIPEDVVLESRIRYITHGGGLFALTLEGLFEQQRELEYYGMGQVPERDPRNRFLSPHHGERLGLYDERKVRLITGLGVRLSPLFEFLVSTSLTRRDIHDAADAGAQAMSQVFEPGSVPGAGTETWTGYGEFAARLDNRATRGRPSSGVLMEAYIGGALAAAQQAPLETHDLGFMRTGGRVAGFIPVYRSTNILSPRLVMDLVIPTSNLPLPFTELARQPDYRGFDTRRDELSLVGSLDYSWSLVDFLGARVFFDAATMAPSAAELSLAQLEELRWAVGAGLDLYISSEDVGQLAISGSPDGVRIMLSIGVPSEHGDRQHRD